MQEFQRTKVAKKKWGFSDERPRFLTYLINLFRNDIILLYDLKQASTNCEFELQSLK